MVNTVDQLIAEARQAIKKLENPTIKPSIEHMGEKIRWQYAKTYQSLADPIETANTSIDILRLAAVANALAFQSVGDDYSEEYVSYAQRIVASYKSGNIDSLASDFYHNLYGNGFGSNQSLHMFEEIGNVFFDQLNHGALALVWFCEAETLLQAKNVIGSLDKLADAFFALVPENEATKRSKFAKLGAEAKLADDPKQKEKTFILKCWQDWQKSPATYKSKAAFARDMLSKCEHLTSQKKIEDWCREWEKGNPAGRVSTEQAW